MPSRSSSPLGPILAAGGAALAIASLWLPWYLIKLPEIFRRAFENAGTEGAAGAAPETPQGQIVAGLGQFMSGLAAAMPSELSGNGWQIMNGGDVALAITAGIALLATIAVGGAFSGVRADAGPAGRLIAGLGAVLVGIALFHVVTRPGSIPHELIGLRYGIWVAVIAGILVIAGGLMMSSPAKQPAPTLQAGFAPPAAPEAPWSPTGSVAPPGS